MVGKIIINGQIGSERFKDGSVIKGVDLDDVVEQYEAQKATALSFEVEIKSPGGFCDVGYSIYEFLKTIPQQVTTIAIDQCASIATVIFLAGERRIAKCPLMIHNPWVGGVTGDADEIQKAADDMRAEEDKLINFYHKITGIEKVALDALMKIETYILPERAVKLKFATEAGETIGEIVNYKAVAKFKNDMSSEIKSLSKRLDSFIEKAEKFFSIEKPKKAKGLTIADGSGKNLDIMNADGSDLTGNPVAGCTVMIEGAPAPDGDYVLPSVNITITVAGGVITSVAESAQEMTLEEALEALKKSNLEKEALSKELLENKKATEELAGKMENLETTLSAIEGKEIEVQPKSQFREQPKEKSLKEKMAEYKEKQKAQEKK